MNFFPVNLNIKNKLCTIIGGGKVAERKIFNLLKYNAKLKVISKNFTENILNIKNNVQIIKANYNKKYLTGSFMVFICTNNKSLNLEIYKHAKEINALVNSATHPELCDFTIPSVLKRGDLKITVSTNGISPALARSIKKELENHFGNEYSVLLEIMRKIRDKQLALNSNSKKNSELFYKFINSETIDLIRKNDFQTINKLIEDIFNFSI